MPARSTSAPTRRPAVLRGAIVVATLALLTPAWQAHAAAKKKPACHLVADAAGDATGTGLPVGAPNDANLDIVGADIATNATTLTAVVRLASLAAGDSSAPTGREYQVVFNVGTTTSSVDAVISPSGTSWAGGIGKGVVDAAKKEIRISVPLSALDVPIKPKTPLTKVGARTYRVLGSDQILLGNTDSADSSSTYIAGWPSCVKVGS
jgi:hypothetical protein